MGEDSRVILENVCRFLLKNNVKDSEKHQDSTHQDSTSKFTINNNLILTILIKIFNLRQNNEIYHLSLEILRTYPDFDLNLEALESLLLLSSKEITSAEVKIDSIKT